MLASNEGLELENYKKLKRDSSLLPVSAIDNIFALPRSGVGNIHSSVNMSNGDLILFRLDAVESGQTDLDKDLAAAKYMVTLSYEPEGLESKEIISINVLILMN